MLKNFIKEYIHLIINTLCILTFSLGFYYILLNSFHSITINKEVANSESNINYITYTDNLNKIKGNLDNYKYQEDKYSYNALNMSRLKNNVSFCYDKLVSDNTILNKGNVKLFKYYDIYKINDNFVNNIIDECFIANFIYFTENKELENYDLTKIIKLEREYVKTLGNNALYIKSELTDNGSYYYNTIVSNSMIRSPINSIYNKILEDYSDFSKIILELSTIVARGDKNE